LNSAGDGPETTLANCSGGNCGLFECVTPVGESVTCTSKTITGYVVYGGDGKTLLECTESGCKSVGDGAEGYYANAGYDKTSKGVILCDGSHACTTIAAKKGYYRNAAVTAAAASSIIKCSSDTSCEIGNAVETTCNKSGSIVYPTSSEWHLCSANSNTGSVKLDTNPAFESITLANTDDFPGAPSTKFIVKVTANSVLVLEGTKIKNHETLLIKKKRIFFKYLKEIILFNSYKIKKNIK